MTDKEFLAKSILTRLAMLSQLDTPTSFDDAVFLRDKIKNIHEATMELCNIIHLENHRNPSE